MTGADAAEKEIVGRLALIHEPHGGCGVIIAPAGEWRQAAVR